MSPVRMAFTALHDACVLYPAPLRDLLMQLAEAFNLGELRAKLVAMENTTWRHIRDDLLHRLPAERNVTPFALPKSAFAA